MSSTGPRGEKHYRLYEIPSHPYIPSFVSDPGREPGYKGQGGGKGCRDARETENRGSRGLRETSEPKRKARSASLLKTIKAWMRFPLKAPLPSKAQMWQYRESLARAGLIRNRLSMTTFQTTRTHRKVDTLHIKA